MCCLHRRRQGQRREARFDEAVAHEDGAEGARRLGDRALDVAHAPGVVGIAEPWLPVEGWLGFVRRRCGLQRDQCPCRPGRRVERCQRLYSGQGDNCQDQSEGDAEQQFLAEAHRKYLVVQRRHKAERRARQSISGRDASRHTFSWRVAVRWWQGWMHSDCSASTHCQGERWRISGRLSDQPISRASLRFPSASACRPRGSRSCSGCRSAPAWRFSASPVGAC